MEEKQYACIDLKSFYASVECVDRGLDPMKTNLVVADPTRTEKTICLAVTSSLKAYGISGRARLFEVIEQVKNINSERKRNSPDGVLTGSSVYDPELKSNPALALDYIVAPPQMAHYMDYSTRIYKVYLKYIAPEDIHVYSIDEVFIDLTTYLKKSGMSAKNYVSMLISDVLATTGITAAAGIGTNLYLAKVAMDIEAKHADPDENGVRIAELDVRSYREKLWSHRPLTDFWRIGRGYSNKLEANGIYTMGDVARCSLGKTESYYNEELLYRLFGINAELLIDHAWGDEPCTIEDIRTYRPSSNSISSGQVLKTPYTFDKAKLVVREMADLMSLDLVRKRLVTDQITLTVGYDIENLKKGSSYAGEVTVDRYGRKIPKHAHGTENLGKQTSSTKKITSAVMALYDRIVDRGLYVRRIELCVCRVVSENEAAKKQTECEQITLFTDYKELEKKEKQEKQELERERRMQETVLELKEKFGKNIILKGMNLEKDATAKERNEQIGGHRA